MSSTRFTDALTRLVDALPEPDDFPSTARNRELTARVGTWLGACFLLAFLTGVWSHLAQLPDPVLPLPTRPVWLYRVTQGVHVAAGTAAVPLLLVKLWSVFPQLFRRPPAVRRAQVLDAAERLSVLVLVSSASFQLVSGLANSAQWYPWSFSFRATHFAIGWVAMGALLVHVAVKLPVIRTAWLEPQGQPAQGTVSRRTVLGVTWAAAAVAVVTTAASGVPGVRRLSVLATRTGTGPGGIPVNKTAAAAGVARAAADPAFALVVAWGDTERRLSRADLEAMPQTTATLPIACVEGWSASGVWGGVRVADLVDLVGAPTGSAVLVESLQRVGASSRSRLPGNVAADREAILALTLAGEPLSLDHGYPCRVIAPNRPGALQTKWVSRLEVRP
ncbi:molybdopterin-dependent oxidoreductase [Phycicoccus sp. Soil748]|uniref:molybdopterin-dependent oxidoreductase n=1 Tax=Phycicoccus sp. Soil748 TaxID=1736397 RepID=UPI000AF423DF|nr:molybdopterin-dependent oxidoreductase [Phycicoccus sp. Soil748]